MGSLEIILEESSVKDFSDWLRTTLVDEAKSKIIKSNYRKISVAIGHAQENISEIQQQFNCLEKGTETKWKIYKSKIERRVKHANTKFGQWGY